MLGKVHWVENFSILRHHLSLEQVIELIKSDEYQERIELIRSLVNIDKKRASELKNGLPGFTPAGVFEGKRTIEVLAKYSGILHLDVDHIKDHSLFEKIKKDPYVLASFVSPSGNGLKVFYRTEKDKLSHTQSIIRLSSWFENKYNERCDLACKDLARLCFISFDTLAYYNEDAKCVDAEITTSINENIQKAIQHVNNKGIGFIPSVSRNRFVYELARYAKSYGVFEQDLIAYCIENYEQSDFQASEIRTTIQSGYKGKYDIIDKKQPILKLKKHEEIKAALSQLGYQFRENIIKDQTEIYNSQSWQVVSDRIENSIVQHLESSVDLNTSIDKIRLILKSNFVSQYDPFADYFLNLDEWDGVDYIEQLYKTLNADSELQYYLERWLVALVANALDTEKPNHCALILVGPQSFGKTRWIQKLVPYDLKGYYYHGVINPRDKDSCLRMSDHLIVNLDELDSIDRRDWPKLKEIITSSSFTIRAPYERNAKVYPRRASIIASINKSEFLNDPTGSRRFLIIEISKPIEHSHSINMDKVFAQAFYLYKSGMKHYFTTEESLVIQERNERFNEIVLEEEYVLQFFTNPSETNSHFMSASEIIGHIQTKLDNKQLKIQPHKLGPALIKLGFVRRKSNGKSGYSVGLKG